MSRTNDMAFSCPAPVGVGTATHGDDENPLRSRNTCPQGHDLDTSGFVQPGRKSPSCRECHRGADRRVYQEYRAKRPLYFTWKSMKDRCLNPRRREWPYYGGRGIRVHDGWRSSYEAFAAYITATIGPKPTPRHSLDRIDVNGHYEPGNVRWATALEQRHNQRRVR